MRLPEQRKELVLQVRISRADSERLDAAMQRLHQLGMRATRSSAMRAALLHWLDVVDRETRA